tara:strand:+ start:9200 stop:9679 length:480 start_codon:yes stop_codon:yes gene_type:complete
MTESVSDDSVDNDFSTDFTIGPVQGLTEIRLKRVESAGANLNLVLLEQTTLMYHLMDRVEALEKRLTLRKEELKPHIQTRIEDLAAQADAITKKLDDNRVDLQMNFLQDWEKHSPDDFVRTDNFDPDNYDFDNMVADDDLTEKIDERIRAIVEQAINNA